MGDFRLSRQQTVKEVYKVPEGKVKDLVNELVTCMYCGPDRRYFLHLAGS